MFSPKNSLTTLALAGALAVGCQTSETETCYEKSSTGAVQCVDTMTAASASSQTNADIDNDHRPDFFICSNHRHPRREGDGGTRRPDWSNWNRDGGFGRGWGCKDEEDDVGTDESELRNGRGSHDCHDESHRANWADASNSGRGGEDHSPGRGHVCNHSSHDGRGDGGVISRDGGSRRDGGSNPGGGRVIPEENFSPNCSAVAGADTDNDSIPDVRDCDCVVNPGAPSDAGTLPPAGDAGVAPDGGLVVD